MKLKTRLGLSVLALVTAVLVAVLAVVSWRESRALLAGADDDRRASVRELARLCETTLAAGQEKILLNFLALWTENNRVVDVGLWDKDGVLQTHSDFLKGDYSGVRATADPALTRAAMEGGLHESPGWAGGRATLDITFPVLQKGEPYGFLRARFDREAVDAESRALVRQTLRALLIVAAGAELVGLGLGLVLAWSLTTTIRRLSLAAEEIGAGKFPATVPVTRSDELGALARDLERMSGELKRASEFKDSFLRRISHNMRSPLAAMESALYHARNVQRGTPAPVEEDYEILQQGLGELTIFVNNLLDLERIRRGKMVYRYEACAGEELVEAVVSLHRRLAEDRGLALRSRAEPGVRPVRADRGILAQILSNLLLNAIKFTPSGGGVELRLAREDGGARMTVADTGRGIPPEALARLFKDFEQVAPDEKGAPKGSGIGLAFCKEAAESMGGRLWAESAPGRGSSFHVWMPEAAA